MNKKSFILHIDSLDILDEMTSEQAGNLIKAIHYYQKNLIEPEMDLVTKMSFIPFRNQFKREHDAYEKKCEKNKLNGQKGGRPPAKKPILSEPKPTKLTKPTKTQKKPIIPTYAEFSEYAKTKSKNIDEELLVNKYDSWIENDWRDGNDKKINSWKSKLLNTLKYLKNEKFTGKTKSFSSSKQAGTYSRSKAIDEAEALFNKPN